MAQRPVSDEEIRAAKAVLFSRWLPNGRGRVELLRWRAYGVQLSVTSMPGTYDDTWIYAYEGDVEPDEAWRAALGWDGEGEPQGWWRHVQSGRRRPGGDPSREHVQP